MIISIISMIIIIGGVTCVLSRWARQAGDAPRGNPPQMYQAITGEEKDGAEGRVRGPGVPLPDNEDRRPTSRPREGEAVDGRVFWSYQVVSVEPGAAVEGAFYASGCGGTAPEPVAAASQRRRGAEDHPTGGPLPRRLNCVEMIHYPFCWVFHCSYSCCIDFLWEKQRFEFAYLDLRSLKLNPLCRGKRLKQMNLYHHHHHHQHLYSIRCN